MHSLIVTLGSNHNVQKSVCKKSAMQVMDMSRESKLNDMIATTLLKNINNKVTELEVSELSFKPLFNEKEPIVGDNKGIFTHLKTVNCDNYCNSTYIYITK